MTITEFLTARLDEAEALWKNASEHGLLLQVPGSAEVWADAEFPRQMLADIAAKRAIVALLIQSERTLQEDVIDEATLLAARHGLLVAQMACRSLTQPFAEHPDFDPAWRV